MSAIPLTYIMSSSYEEARSVGYHWDNARRGPDLGLVFQYSFAGRGGYESRDEGRLDWPPHHAMLCRHGESSRYFYPPEASTTWSYCWVNFLGGSEIWQSLREQYGSLVPLPPGGETLHCLRDLTERQESKSFRDGLEASELLYRFLMALIRELRSSPQLNPSPVEEAVRYLRDHHNRPLTVKELAARAGYTREHFTRLFVERVGETPGAMLRRLRMETACYLLQFQALTVREVARQSGFSDPVAFNRAFGRVMGCTPLAYRHRSQG